MKAGTGCRSLLSAIHGKPASTALRRAVALAALLLPSLLFSGSAAAQPVHASRPDVEAAYLYNFGKFVRWPHQEQLQTLNICILGHDPFGASLDRIVAGERIDGEPLKITRISNIEAAQSCAMLFISSSEASRLDDVITALANSPVMTVSDMPDFIKRGGMIQFVLQHDRVRFMVNRKAADRCGLTLSSQLLKVAAAVSNGSSAKEAK